MLWTDKSLHVTFGIASVLGRGARLGWPRRWRTRSFRWEGFASMEDLRNQLVGAVLMGFGGVTALGCTIGQGLSGVSTLAIGSFIAVAGIVGRLGGDAEVHAWRPNGAGLNMKRTVWLIAALLLAMRCAAPPARAPVDIAWVAEARARGRRRCRRSCCRCCRRRSPRGGPEGAIAVCRDEAPALARAASEESGWSVRRVSLRNRNPKAVPDAWERAALEDFDRRAAAERVSRPRSNGPRWCTQDGKPVQRYMRALPTIDAVHAAATARPTQLSPAVTARLKALYPRRPRHRLRDRRRSAAR